MSDRERFKKHLGEMVAENRSREESATPAPNGGAVAMDLDEDVKPDLSALTSASKGKGKAVPPPPPPSSSSTRAPPRPVYGAPAPQPGPTSDFHLRKLILQSDASLLSLHRDLVISRQLTETEFWEGRSDLLAAARAAEEQMKGRSGAMVDPRPEVGEGGEVTVRVTAQMVGEIFEEYPSVRRAYDENVPEPVRSSLPFPSLPFLRRRFSSLDGALITFVPPGCFLRPPSISHYQSYPVSSRLSTPCSPPSLPSPSSLAHSYPTRTHSSTNSNSGRVISNPSSSTVIGQPTGTP